MGQVIHFEEQAVARLRQRLGAAEEANEDLVAFARGHSGAVASINWAVLEAIEAPSVEGVLDVITGRWPLTLATGCNCPGSTGPGRPCAGHARGSDHP